MNYNGTDFGLKTGRYNENSAQEMIGWEGTGMTHYEEPKMMKISDGDTFVYQQISDAEGIADRGKVGRINEEARELESIELSDMEDLREALEPVINGPIESV